MGWGARPYISEYSPSGKLLFDAHLMGENASYRAYVQPWNGRPDPRVSPPSLAVAHTRRGLVVYASWNGATRVSSWRVLGGSRPTALHRVATDRRIGSESATSVGRYAYVAVQAVDGSGHVLATSATQPAS